jgi:hypothetical protein
VLCQVVVNSGTTNASAICDVLKKITGLLAVSQGGSAGLQRSATATPQIGTSSRSTSLAGLLGGGQG